MRDVGETGKVGHCVLEGSEEHWQRFIRFSNKAVVRDFVDFEDAFIFTEFFGNQAYHTPVVCIGIDPDQPNGRLCLSLLETDRLSAMSDEELRLEVAKKLGPVRRLRVNAAPTLTTLYEATEQMLGSISVDELETRSRLVMCAVRHGFRSKRVILSSAYLLNDCNALREYASVSDV